MDRHPPIRKHNPPALRPEEVFSESAGGQSMPEITSEGVRQLADFILLLAKWDRMLTSSESEPFTATNREAA